MAKKKSRKVPVKKPAPKLDKIFDCPFCNHAQCIEIKMDRDKKIGHLNCRICKVSFASKINHLSQEVDVYCDWIDECHKLNDKGGMIEDDQDGEMLEEDDDMGDMIKAK